MVKNKAISRFSWPTQEGRINFDVIRFILQSCVTLEFHFIPQMADKLLSTNLD
jgi:hypothetical protein